ncbi:MAG: hypothetical protein WCY85_07400, partial [Sulfurimonas sp.]
IVSSTNYPLYTKIKKQFDTDISKDITKKQSSIQEATKKREQTAKAKIINAINILRLEDKEITAYAIAKESGCSYNTVKKYQSKEVLNECY